MSIVKVAVVVTTGLLIEAAFERLEPCVEKLTSTVLMGLGLSNEPRLPNFSVTICQDLTMMAFGP